MVKLFLGITSILHWKYSKMDFFIVHSDNDGSAIITREGFQFLLMDTAAQVWYFILQYLSTVEEKGLDLSLCLNFLFQLRFSILGKVG